MIANDNIVVKQQNQAHIGFYSNRNILKIFGIFGSSRIIVKKE